MGGSAGHGTVREECSRSYPTSLHVDEEIRQMKEERGSDRQTVDAIEHAAMPRQKRACILDPHVPLDGGNEDISEEASDADEHSECYRAHSGERGEIRCNERTCNGRDSHAADKTAPCFVRAHERDDPPATETFSGHVLRHIIPLRECDDIQHKPCGASLWVGRSR